jgi:hypothetical protein
MADGLEQPRIWWRRAARRRWLCLGLTWLTCALGWSVVCLLSGYRPAVAAGALLSLALLAGIAVGAAVFVARREPVFERAAELQLAFGRPVLGSVADLRASRWRRAGTRIPFVLTGLGLLAVAAALLALRAWGSLAAP